jgi:hypothetical protein
MKQPAPMTLGNMRENGVAGRGKKQAGPDRCKFSEYTSKMIVYSDPHDEMKEAAH